jgi:uracil-DNA glycosylase
MPGFKTPESGNLENWAKQGVLMLNSVLTVQANLPGSHKNFGWQHFTDAIIKLVSQQKEQVVFLLWGNYAMSKSELIDGAKHLILTAAHPSPLARGAFFGSKHFSKTNHYLMQHDKEPIIWNLS